MSESWMNKQKGRMFGRRALVTGAASGIGAATAKLFAREGAKLALVDRSKKSLEMIAQSLDAVSFAVDLGDLDEISNTVNSAASALGGIDCIVNAAGIISIVQIEDMNIDDWEELLKVNLTAPFLVCRAGIPHLRKSQAATIVNISSGIAIRPMAQYGGYAASKAGLLALTKVLAQELSPSIRANAVCPGPIETPLIRDLYPDEHSQKRSYENYALRRFGKPQEVADAILFLSSSESSYITGVSIPVDGGRSFY